VRSGIAPRCAAAADGSALGIVAVQRWEYGTEVSSVSVTSRTLSLSFRCMLGRHRTTSIGSGFRRASADVD